MNTAQQINLVQAWGFQALTADTFTRQAPKGFTEYWSTRRPDYIEFADDEDNFSHDYKIDWSLFI